MRRDFVFGIVLALSAIPYGAAMMAAPEYLHLSPTGVFLSFWGGLVGTIVLIGWATGIALRDDAKAPAEGHKRRMVPIVGMVIFGLGFVTCAAWYFWPVRTEAKPAISVAISQMAEPQFVNKPMFEAEWENDNQVFVIPDVFLSNLSDSHPLTLEISLELRGNGYKDSILKGDGKAGLLKTYGKDDAGAKMLKRFTGQEKPINYLLSPIALDPQKTAYGTLVFVQPFTVPSVKGSVVDAVVSHKISYVLMCVMSPRVLPWKCPSRANIEA